MTARAVEPLPARVFQAMSRDVVTVAADAEMREARRLAQSTGAQHLLVVDGAELVGILCTCDLGRAPARAPVSDHMAVPVLTVSPETLVEDAAETMRECDVGCLPVLRGGLIVGAVSRERLGDLPDGAPRCRCRCHRRRRARA